jgi:hypothetical protein
VASAQKISQKETKMNKRMNEGYKAFHQLFRMSCSMRAELDRLLVMAKAYPHLQDILDEHYDPAVDSEMVRALGAAMQYDTERTFPPTHIVQQLYIAAVQVLDKLDCIERDRLTAVQLAGNAANLPEQRHLAKVLEDFNVNVGEVNVPARKTIEAMRPYLQVRAGARRELQLAR